VGIIIQSITTKKSNYQIIVRRKTPTDKDQSYLMEIKKLKGPIFSVGALSVSPKKICFAYSIDTKGDERYTAR